ncbi:hypothetical protein [Spirosoma endophyticum]|uniref:Uncharacterized protein n=1 Tax=Spirosoma endophyticum TaxID=662367 RepID=A0A1I2GHR7_9BACT|nr:hypothetical protein [Spirosoma endophyticum]SFF16778.1 hypothetical protein SAMN05216167_13236 [Spirosoma endophyticum]
MNKCRLLLLLFGLSFSGCKHIEPSVEEPTVVITGSLSQPVKSDVVLPPAAYQPGLLGLHRPDDTTTTRLVAWGGSLMAGYRDGGLYREGQLTCIPALIAHQMRLASFVSPLFDPAVGNGTGYLVYDQTDPLPSWKRVSNQTGVISTNPLVLSKYNGPMPDNLALPYGVGAKPADSARVDYTYPAQRNYYAYLNRLFPTNQPERYDLITRLMDARQIHLLLYEPDFDIYVGVAINPELVSDRLSRYTGSGTIFYAFQKDVLDSQNLGRKVVMYNRPDLMDFPYFHLYDAKKLQAMNITSGVVLADSALLIPNDKIKQAFAQKGALPIVLEDKDVLSKQEVKLFQLNAFMNYDYSLPYLSKVTGNTPIVDLYSLYKRVINRQYTTEDGLFIDPSFPNGNFFSQDGLYPSAIGSAVIANETIKVINQAYKTSIPLINVREYASLLP